MKLHKVTIHNLNSLYGENVIDFDRDLERAALFLIVGPTGAGKSTILDAICLALFGQTPRLSRTNGKPDTDPALVMSYGTGRCSAIVEFSLRDPESGDRRRYRATWDCRRAREKPTGNIQTPERSLHRIHDDGAEELLISDSRQKYFGEVFDGVLQGLTVQDFQRSVLLAQGEFAAFLKADEGVKANILERLTNTDTYRRIGQRAARKRQLLSDQLKAHQARLDGLSLLSEADEQALREQLIARQDAADAARADARAASALRDWRARAVQLDREESERADKLDQCQLALRARDEDLARLAEDARCRPGRAPLGEAERALAARDTLREELPALRTRAEAADAVCASATAALTHATAQSDAATVALNRARPPIERGLSLLTTLEQTQTEHAREAARAQETAKRHALAEQKHQHATQRATHTREAVTDAASALDALAASAPLVEQLAALQTQAKAARELHQRALDEAKLRDAHAAEVADARAKIVQLEAARADASARVAPETARHEAARQALDAALEGAEDARARHAILQAQQRDQEARVGAWREAARAHEGLIELWRDEDALLRQQQRAQHAVTTQQERLASLQRERDALAIALEAQLANLHRLELELTLSDRRLALQPGIPCPLCGSEEHPFIQEGAEDPDVARRVERERISARAAHARQDLDEVANQHRAAELELQRALTELSGAQTQRERLGAQLNARLGALNSALASVGHDAQTRESARELAPSLTRETIEAAQADLATLNAARAALHDLQAEVEAAHEALRGAQESISKLDAQLTGEQTREALRAESQQRFSEGAQRLSDDWQRAMSALRDQLNQLNVQVEGDDQGALDDALTRAQAARDAFGAAQQRHGAASRAADEAMREQTTAAHEVVEASQLHEAALRDLQARETTREALRAELDGLFEGRDPRDVQRALEEARQSATRALDSARTNLQQALQTQTTARTLYEERQRQLRDAEARERQAQDSLTNALTALALPDAAALRARLLDDATRDALETSLRELRDAQARAQLALESTRQLRAEHQQARPQSLNDDLNALDLDALIAHVEALEAASQAATEALGAARERLAQQEQARAQAAELVSQLQAQQQELNTWETIYQLIGRRDGEMFQRFAQSLNLQELVNRANARLLRLAPRYRLAVARGEEGEPRLDFVVRDQHHADAERPLTTLSGGETFLVSLALALALADFRRVDMPVETLLLDEGFGTLDQDTLDVAMSTLRQLQQESSQQIGIISHVESLKERVDCRILVERQSNGRSRLRLERPSRHRLAMGE